MGFLAQSLSPPKFDMGEVAREYERIAAIIAETIAPIKIILFGSAADGSFGAHSDIDLLIVVETQDAIRNARIALATRRILPKWPCDYLFVTEARFEQAKNLGGPVYMAYNFGKVLYDQRTVV